MGYEAIRLQIQTRFETEWTTTPIAWEGVPFDPPDNLPWVRLTIRPGSRSQVSIGSSTKLWRVVGAIIIQFFTPLDYGSKAKEELIDTGSNVFRGKSFDDVNIYGEDRIDVGQDGEYNQTNLSFNFKYDEYI